jgi:predicted PhzF superfamily epimerase YddE/YHI9
VYHLLNVFTNPEGAYGNALGVFLDRPGLPEEERQRIAHELNYSETVFVEEPARGVLHIHTPAHELPFAGHPTVGSAWLLARELGSCDVLRLPAGEVPTWQDGDLRWIRARAEWAPQMELLELGSPAEVDALEGAPAPYGFADCWAWIDEDAGLVRSRVFAPVEGIPEDEATGAAAVRMCAHLGREIEIRQGAGSVLHARPGPDETVEVGGRVRYVGEREYG